MKTLVAKVLAIFVVSSGLVCAAQVNPSPLFAEQFSVSPGSESFKESKFLVKTELKTKYPCIAISMQNRGVTVLISRALLENLAAIGPEGYGIGGEARLDSIYGERARRFLKTVPKTHSKNRCAVATLDGETQYLLGRLLASGQVTVFDETAHRAVSPVIASVTEMPGVHGMVAYQIAKPESAQTFFILQLWVH